MNSAIDKFFDLLKRKLDILSNSNADNEAMRHDLIVRPIITNPLVLGWDSGEVISQSVLEIPMDVLKSYFWDKAEPKKKRPDMIIVPYGMKKTVAIVEEKKNKHHWTRWQKRSVKLRNINIFIMLYGEY